MNSTHTSLETGSATHQATIVPTYRTLLTAVVVVCTLGMAANLLAAIATDVVDDGPRTLQQQLAGVLGFGAAGLAISLAGAWWFTRQPGRSRIGAIVYGALSVPTLLLFFSGTPAMFGVTAAFLAGLTRGRRPETGAPRVFGTVGLVLAVVNVCVTILGVTIAWLTD